MAKSGRGQSVSSLLDTASRRGKPRRNSRTRAAVAYVIAALIALPTAGVMLFGSLKLITAQSDQEAYDKAPYCVGTDYTDSCVLRTTAKVEWVDASRNTGKNAHGYTTKASLLPDNGRYQTVTLSKHDDLTMDVKAGDRWPVLLWHDEITRYTREGKTHNAAQNPHHVVAVWLVAVSVCAAVGSVTARPLLRRMVRRRVLLNPAAHRVPDLALAVLVPATGTAAILRASYFAAGFALTAVVVLIGSALVWPFLPWVRRENPDSLLGQSQAANGRKKR